MNASLEKADDGLPLLKVEGGDDDAKTIFCPERRQLRPPVVEIKRIMDWYPTKWDAVVRNLPLAVCSLVDNINPKCIELCHK